MDWIAGLVRRIWTSSGVSAHKRAPDSDGQVPEHLSPAVQEQDNQRLHELVMEPSLSTFL